MPQGVLVRVQSKAPSFANKKRAGVIPLEALCSDAHLLWISCRDERSLTVTGVKSYPLWEPECQP